MRGRAVSGDAGAGRAEGGDLACLVAPGLEKGAKLPTADARSLLMPPRETQPAQGEMTLIQFYQRAAQEIGSDAKEVLNFLVRGLIDRGWLPTVAGLVSQLSDELSEARVRSGLTTLERYRLVTRDLAGARFADILGSVSVGRTPHRAHLEGGVDIFVAGGLELLAVNPALTKGVDGFTTCGQCGADVHVVVAGEAVTETKPAGIAAFQASWDGQSELREVYERSPLFCSDACLEAWTAAHPDVDGLPMSGDLLLFVGMGMQQESGTARFRCLDLGH